MKRIILIEDILELTENLNQDYDEFTIEDFTIANPIKKNKKNLAIFNSNAEGYIYEGSRKPIKTKKNNKDLKTTIGNFLNIIKSRDKTEFLVVCKPYYNIIKNICESNGIKIIENKFLEEDYHWKSSNAYSQILWN